MTIKMSKSEWKVLLQVADEGIRDVRAELRAGHAQCRQSSKMVANSLGTVSSLRTICQKWSKVDDKSDSKALLGEYTLLLTELVLIDLVNLPNNISNEDIIDKYSKVISFSIANISKVFQSINNIENTNNLINMIKSLSDFVNMRVINMHRLNKDLFLSNDNIMGRFILHYIQSLCQLVMRFRTDHNYDMLMQQIIVSIHHYYAYDSKLDIIKSVLTNEQVLAALSYIIDSIWLLTLKTDTLKTFNSTEMIDSIRDNIIHTYFNYNTTNSTKLTCTRILDTMIQHFHLLLRQQLHSKAINLIKQGINFVVIRHSEHKLPLFDSNECNRFVLWLLEISSKVQIPELCSTDVIDTVGAAWNYTVELARCNSSRHELNWNILLTICTIETYIYSTRLRVHATTMCPLNDEMYHELVSAILNADNKLSIDSEDVAYVEVLAKLYTSCLNYEVLYTRSNAVAANTSTITTKVLSRITHIYIESRKSINDNDATKRTNNAIKISNALTRSFITGLNIIQNVINENNSNQCQHQFATTVIVDILSNMTGVEIWNEHSVPSILTVLKSLSNTANNLLGPVPVGLMTTDLMQLMHNCNIESTKPDMEAVVLTFVTLIINKASANQQFSDVSSSIAISLPQIYQQFQPGQCNQVAPASYRRLLTLHIKSLIKQLKEFKNSDHELLCSYLDTIVAAEPLCQELMDALNQEVVSPTSASKSSLQDLYSFVELFFEYFTTKKVNCSWMVKEAQVNRLYLLSHLLWSGRVGIGSEHSRGITNTLRDYGNEYDAVSMSIINRSKKGKKTSNIASSLADGDGIGAYFNNVVALRVWTLLAQWAFPAINTSKAEIAESDGFQGSCIYLNNAVKSFKNIVSAYSTRCNSSGNSNNRDTSMATDAKVLYHMLGLHGRLDDQHKLVTYFRDIARGNSSINSSAKAIYEEIVILHSISIVWNSYGDQKLCFDDINDASSHINDSWQACVHTYISRVMTILSNRDAIDDSEFGSLSENAYSVIPSNTRLCSTGHVLLKTWICLLAGKVYLYHFSAHRQSYLWIRKGLNMILPLSDTVLGPGFSLDIALPRLEGVLLLAEVHEQCGNIDSTLAYISEAYATSKIGSNALHNIVSLHCMRIWYRMDSARFSLALEELCQVDNESNNMEHLYDDVSKSIKKAARCLSSLLLLNEDDKYSETDNNKMHFRHVVRSWDIDRLKEFSSRGAVESNPWGVYNTNISDELRDELHTLFSNGNSAIVEYINVMKRLECSYCFDVIRNVRRRACVDIANGKFGEELKISQSIKISTSMFTFILGSASCGISTECLLEKETSSSKRGVVADAIRKACIGDRAAIDDIFYQFDTLLDGSLSSCNYKKICFLTLEESSNTLMIGSYDRSSPTVATLPIGKAILDVITRWNELMTKSKDNLQKTMDIEKVNKWSDEEKRNWWNNRKKSDEEISEVLAHIESLLGDYKHILIPSLQEDIDQLVTATQSLSIDSKNKKATKTLANTCSSGATLDPSASARVSSKKNEEQLRLLKVTELKELLKEIGLSMKGTKEELIDRLVNYYNNHDVVSSPNSANADGNKRHVLLILDEKLQGIPWECLPSFRYVCCSRLPSLNLLLQIIQTITLPPLYDMVGQPTCAWDENTMAVANTREMKTSKSVKAVVNCDNATPSIKVNSCWYAVDPENNLPNTRVTMQGFLEPYTVKYNWRGYIGEIPPLSDIKSYHDSCDLFIYCGHGAGEKLIDSKAIKRSLTCPASLLWGCSSGKLVVHGIHDPTGAALSYLIGGAPYVLGNLWDVTDKDIDRLTIQCMSSYLDSIEETDKCKKETSICDSLVKARDCCKLKYAVGSAPVIYGISLPLK